MRNVTASTANTFRRPHQSDGRPTMNDPNIVPIRAMETVKPQRPSLKWKTPTSDFSVPEITPVSKPNRNEPSAATTVLVHNKTSPCRDTVVRLGASIDIVVLAGLKGMRRIDDCG